MEECRKCTETTLSDDDRQVERGFLGGITLEAR